MPPGIAGFELSMLFLNIPCKLEIMLMITVFLSCPREMPQYSTWCVEISARNCKSALNFENGWLALIKSIDCFRLISIFISIMLPKWGGNKLKIILRKMFYSSVEPVYTRYFVGRGLYSVLTDYLILEWEWLEKQ